MYNIQPSNEMMTLTVFVRSQQKTKQKTRNQYNEENKYTNKSDRSYLN